MEAPKPQTTAETPSGLLFQSPPSELFEGVSLPPPEWTVQDESNPPLQRKHSQWVTLLCGTRSFQLRRAMLQQHPIFAQHMKHHPHDTEIELAALNGDEEMAVHIATYLEDPDTFPLFRSAQWGFHYALYHHLQKAARALELYDLHDWIAEKRYVRAIKTVVDTTIEEVEPGQLPSTVQYEGDAEVTVDMLQKTRYFHFCPRAIPAHRVERDKENRCGRKCELLREVGHSRLEEEPYVEIVTVTKRVVFDPEVCTRGAPAAIGDIKLDGSCQDDGPFVGGVMRW